MVTERSFDEARKLLVRCARATQSYGADVVIGGRMALVLYRLHGELNAGTRRILATREVDVVVPRKLPVRGDPIVKQLAANDLVPFDAPGLNRKSRGKRIFQDKRHGTDRPAREFVEFVAPRVTESDSMLEPQPELVASPLRYIDLLLFEPIAVGVDDVVIYVADPAMFIAQKMLMRDSRSGRKQDKDLVGVYEACFLSSARWEREREVVSRAMNADATWKKWLRRVPALLDASFATPTSTGAIVSELAFRGDAEAPSALAASRVVQAAARAIFSAP